MAKTSPVSVTGGPQIIKRLNKLSLSMALKAKNALHAEALIEQKESMRRTPVDTGALRGSHETLPPKMVGTTISCEIQVGGASAPYAVHVHEDLSAYHSVGQAKFLESTVRESAPFMAQRVGRRMNITKKDVM